MMKNYIIGSIILFALNFNISGQGDNIFKEDIVHEIKVTFEESDYWQILTSNYDNNYPNVPYLMADIKMDGELVDSIGVRLKGFSSYFATSGDKKSIKLDFNEFVRGKKYDGLNKLNLHNGTGDPAMQRDVICYDLLRKSSIEAPRTAYANVYLNDTYWGVYMIVEQIDKTFLNDNFSSDEGHLFKNVGFSDLNWQGANVAEYQNNFELKVGDDPEAWNRFVNFIDILNNSSDQEFKAEIEKVFDVDRYLKVLSVDIVTNNWDSYIDHGRNFYIYENPDNGLFQWLPWDYNLAMDGNIIEDGGGNGGGDDLPDDPANCSSIANGSSPYMATDSIFLEVIAIDNFCCNVAWDENCQAIYDDILAQGSGPSLGNGFSIDFTNSNKVLVERLLAVPEYRERYYEIWCNLLAFNFTSERIFPTIDYNGELIREDVMRDPNYLFSFDDFELDLNQGNVITGLKKYITENEENFGEELEGLYDCMSLASDLEYNDVVINEFCASCDSLSGIADNQGDYDDWIEIYNNTNQTIDLSNAYLTDDPEVLDKWGFPGQTIIEPNGYMIVWADNDIGDSGLHANFKLSKSGESIILMDGATILDSITYGQQVTNQTMSRVPNGTGAFTINSNTTFNFNNDQLSSNNNLVTEVKEISIYPNPAYDRITILNGNDIDLSGIKIFNTLGRELSIPLNYDLTDRQVIIDVSSIEAGSYWLSIYTDEGITSKKLIIQK